MAAFLAISILTFLQLFVEALRNGIPTWNLRSIGVLIEKIIFFSCFLA
jgi:hypothetical protein